MAGKLSNILKANCDRIMSLWEERSLKEVPAAVNAESLALRNSLPVYLEHLALALESNRRMDMKSVRAHDQESIRIGKLHGADRAGNTTYVLTEVIFEYHILREVIFSVLEADGQIGAECRDIILDSIEQAVNDAATEFSEVHADIQSKLMNTLTHDLKTPLTAAKLSAQLIMKYSDKPEVCGVSAARIIGGINRVESMINTLLDASRVRAGENLDIELGPCDMDTILREVMDEMAMIYGPRYILKSCGSVEGQWGGDGLRRTVENLLGNAAKYSTPETPITVTLRRSQDCFIVEVHNEGAAIPSSEIPRLFEQYKRMRKDAQGPKKGWGLGLTLVKGVVDAHGGKIRVESSLDAGTKFLLEIPYLVSKEKPHTSTMKAGVSSTTLQSAESSYQ